MSDAGEDSRKPTLGRRALLLASSSIGLGSALGACESGPPPGVRIGREGAQGTSSKPAGEAKAAGEPRRADAVSPILSRLPLGAPPWKTFDPFLFCVHHADHYPAGNAQLGPRASLDGRNIGQDFAGKDGWSMYHGDVVPGFPRHPHRGFETVTITRRGHVDHSDSLGATARYGQGDVQWMTAGAGIVHAEMFPLLDSARTNPTELFQIWLNLPARSKFAKPYFSMFWDRMVPRHASVDGSGRTTRVTVIAGALEGARPPAPPPDSWASRPEADVAIWSIRMDAGARWQLPAAAAGTDRTLYFFAGKGLRAGGSDIAEHSALRLRPAISIEFEAGTTETELLLLQGRPIGEPVVQHGPFVMNHRSEIEQAVRDYQRTQFGGWPWPKSDPVHASNSGRFARHADGRIERA